MKVGVYIDVSNVYHKLNRKFNGSKLNYGKLMFSISNSFGNVIRTFAYGVQREKEATGFITCLRAYGIEPRFKRPKIIRVGDREIKQCNWGVGITVDVVRLVDKLDIIVLVSSDPDLIPLVKWIRDQGKQAIIFASCIPKSLRDVASGVIEITEGLLEE